MLKSVNRRNIEVIDDALAAVLRQKTPAERIAMTRMQWNSLKSPPPGPNTIIPIGRKAKSKTK